jgi:hypothetical protein
MFKIIPSYHGFIHSCDFQIPTALGNSLKSSMECIAATLPLLGAHFHSVRPFVTLLPIYNILATSGVQGSLLKKSWLMFRNALELGTTLLQPIHDHDTPMYPHAFCNMAESLYQGYHSQTRIALAEQILRLGSNVVYFGAIWDLQRDKTKVSAALAIAAVYQGFLCGVSCLKLRQWSTLSSCQQLVLGLDLFTKGALCIIRLSQAMHERNWQEQKFIPPLKPKPRNPELVH